MSSTRYRVDIMKRDEKILKRIYEQRTMLFMQIREHFFASASRDTAYQRLSKLTKYGILKADQVKLNNKWCTHYYLTKDGYSLIKELMRYEILSPSFKSSSVKHDLMLVDIRKKLESTKMVKETICENILQTSNCSQQILKCDNFRILNTDMALQVNNGHGVLWLPLEWEASNKGGGRLLQKLLSYYTASDIPAVLYICADKKILKNLQSCDKKICKDFSPKVFTCLIEDVLHSNDEVHFINLKKQTFKLL